MPHPPSVAVPTAHSPALSPSSTDLTRKARFWDRIARKYASDPIADMAGYEATLQRVRGLLAAEMDVLEIGCGTGSTALRLASHTRRMLATDVSTGMIAIAQDKLAAQALPQLSFAVADADTPVFGQGAWDAVLAFNLLHLVDDLDAAIGAAVRALRPGGLFISKTPCLNEMNFLVPRVALPLMRAIGKAPPVLCFDAMQLQTALARQGLLVEAMERHGTKGKDPRVFIAARKP